MLAGCNWYLVDSWNRAARKNHTAKQNPGAAQNTRVPKSLTAARCFSERAMVGAIVLEDLNSTSQLCITRLSSAEILRISRLSQSQSLISAFSVLLKKKFLSKNLYYYLR